MTTQLKVPPGTLDVASTTASWPWSIDTLERLIAGGWPATVWTGGAVTLSAIGVAAVPEEWLTSKAVTLTL